MGIIHQSTKTPTQVPPRSIVPDLMQEYGGATKRLLLRYLPSAEPRRYLYDLVGEYPRRGGRGLRPSLCIATARAFGAPMEAAIRTAVSIEILHNAMLIHDDIQDESRERRGRPTLHVAEGIPISINVGDFLSMLAFRPLLDNIPVLGPFLALSIIEETARMASESAEGQAMELGWRRDNAVDVRECDYLEMVLKKTCWLGVIHPSRIGALIGAMGAIDLDPFIRYGFFVGAAFQIQDDLLNLEGDAKAYGKELGGDIQEGKRTLMLIHLLENASPDERDEIEVMLAQSRETRDEAKVRRILRLMDRYGSIEYARQLAHGLVGAAMYEFEQLYSELPESRDRQFIEALPRWVIERN